MGNFRAYTFIDMEGNFWARGFAVDVTAHWKQEAGSAKSAAGVSALAAAARSLGSVQASSMGPLPTKPCLRWRADSARCNSFHILLF